MTVHIFIILNNWLQLSRDSLYGKKGLTYVFEKYESDPDVQADENEPRKIAIASGTASWLIGISIRDTMPTADESLFNNEHSSFDVKSNLLDVPASLGKLRCMKQVYDSQMEKLASNWTYRMGLATLYIDF